MAKRFTDTEKWKKAWFRKLSPKMKAMWEYLRDNCDPAGIWEEDYEAASFDIGEAITRDECVQAFQHRFQMIGDSKIFIPGFAPFQYGELKGDSKPHASVIKRLKALSIDPVTLTLTQPLGNPKRRVTRTLMDKDKDKDLAKEKEKESSSFDFESLYAKYPRRVEKQEALKRMVRVIKTQDDFDGLSRAIDRYKAKLQADGTPERYIKHMPTFIECRDSKPYTYPWKDWLDPMTGTQPADAAPPVISREEQEALDRIARDRTERGFFQ